MKGFSALWTKLILKSYGWRPFLKTAGSRSGKKVYCAGFMLLDLEDPSKVLGVYKEPLLMPEAPYELYDGFRNNVIFPCGMIEENGIAKSTTAPQTPSPASPPPKPRT